MLLSALLDYIDMDKMKFSGRALIVEDNAINQIVLKAQLELLGLAVDIARNGREALELLEPEKYVIVFMDIQMPIMDGIECTRAIRGSDTISVSKLPVIAVTANVTSHYRSSCKECGMDDFIAKPVDAALLMEAIAGFITGENT